MANDSYNVVGIEFSITFSSLTTEQTSALNDAIGRTDNDTIQTDLIKSTVASLCSLVEQYMERLNRIGEKIRVEQEFDPFATIEEGEITIFASVNACYFEAYEEVTGVVYSDEFSDFVIKETEKLIFAALSSRLPWIKRNSFKVEIDSFGEG